MRLGMRFLVVVVLLAAVAIGSFGSPVGAQEPTTTATPTETSGVASDRGLASGAVAVVLVGATLLFLWRRRRSTE